MASYSRHHARCRVCQKHRDDVGMLTASGLCLEHANERQAENLRQLKAHSGPFFRHWRQQIAASVGARLLDETPDEG